MQYSALCVLSVFTGEDGPAKVMTELITKHKPLTQKWEGLIGSDHLPRCVWSAVYCFL